MLLANTERRDPMNESARVQDWLRDAGEASLLVVRSHVASETTGDAKTICETISPDVFFAVPVRTRRGNEIPPGTVLTSFDQVNDYYSKRVGSYVVLDSTQLKSIAGDWYVFNESAARLRGTGRIGDVDATDREFVVNSAVLFPTAADGIRGEICVTRHPFEDVVAATLPPPEPESTSYPAREMVHSALLDRFVEALREAKPEEIGALLGDVHRMALRVDSVEGVPRIHAGEGREFAQEVLAALFRGSRDVAVVSRVASTWYVFAEYLARFEDGRLRRLAVTHPLEDGEITGCFGYGRDEAFPRS